MRFQFKVLILLSVGLLTNCSDDQANERVKADNRDPLDSAVLPATDGVGAFNITDGKAPEAVVTASTLVYRSGNGLCTATLIGPHHALSASHCVGSTALASNSIGFGTTAKQASYRKVTKIVTGRAAGTGGRDDIALVTFEGTVPANYKIASLPLANLSLANGTVVTIAGFGKSDVTVQNSAGTLLQGQSRISGFDNQNKMIVLQRVNGTGLCFGDSGGPTFMNDSGKLTVIGVTSAGSSSQCDGSAYVVDTRLYLKWVQDNGDDELRAFLKTRATTSPAPAPTTSAPAPAPTTKPADNVVLSTFARRVLELSNQARTAAGLAPLALSAALTKAALGHALDMQQQGYLSHTSVSGTGPRDRVKAAGYQASVVSENIAYGYPSAEAVVGAWLNSQGHRDNILSPSVTEIGVGVAEGNRPFWVQVFAKP